MKLTPALLALSLLALPVCPAVAHIIGDETHDARESVYDFTVRPPSRVLLRAVKGEMILAQVANSEREASSAAKKPVTASSADIQKVFAAFVPQVRTRLDQDFLYVESNGMPDHSMMVGITAWQQQVPLPQPYVGNNAWRVPLHPVPAKMALSIKGQFLRGAIALAVNGIPIFNPQNNRGEVSQEIGELDQWGGHCGRADDYHYHAAPFHLQSVAGKGQPIAYALDGYPIYGLTEPDGSAPVKLDAFNGHEISGLGYHYHGSTKYPYVNGGFHGEVVQREGQVDPQPRAQTYREAGTPLRGAKITGFSVKDKSYSLKYEVSGSMRFVNYVVNDNGTVKFDFVDGTGQVKSEAYTPRQGDGGGRPPGEKGRDGQKQGPPRGEGGRLPGDRADARPGDNNRSSTPAVSFIPKRSGNLKLKSSAVAADGKLPTEFTGDGASVSPPLEWSGAPAGTKGYAVIMHHIDPEGIAKWYWTLYNIPAEVQALPKNVQGIGTLGNNSVNRRLGYAPPHSKGPGAKTYILTVYALSAPIQISVPSAEVNRDVLITAMKDLILDSAELKVTYDRTGAIGGSAGSPDEKKKGDRKP